MFGAYPWEVALLFFKGNTGEVDLGERGGEGRDWEEWREGKQWSGYNV